MIYLKAPFKEKILHYSDFIGILFKIKFILQVHLISNTKPYYIVYEILKIRSVKRASDQLSRTYTR